MKGLSFLRKKTPCALDLGHNWAKVIQLEATRKGVEISSIGRLAWTRAERDKKDQVASKLQNLWQNLDLRERSVISSMAGHAVIIKRVDFFLPENQSPEETIFKQAKEHIPFDINDVYLDYEIMGEGRSNGSKNVLLVASKKQMVNELLDVFNKAGLEASIIDVDGFALSNCFEFNYPELLSSTTYLLDIGSAHSIFCVYAQNQPTFIRDVGFGGQHVTERLATSLDKKYSDVEKLKLSGPENLEKEEKERFVKELEMIFISWADEIQRLINFYQNSQEQAQGADKIYLAGGGSLISGLSTVLSDHLNIEVHYLNPWRNITWDDRKIDSSYLRNIAPQFAIALGLALRAVV